MERFYCEGRREFDKHLGNKTTHLENREVKLTQDVRLQRYLDKFDLPKQTTLTHWTDGNVLTKGNPNDSLRKREKTYYRSCIEKILCMVKWSIPDIKNQVWDAARHVKISSDSLMKAMCRIMSNCLGAQNNGLTLNPIYKWHGDSSNKNKCRQQSFLPIWHSGIQLLNHGRHGSHGLPRTGRSSWLPVTAAGHIRYCTDDSYVWSMLYIACTFLWLVVGDWQSKIKNKNPLSMIAVKYMALEISFCLLFLLNTDYFGWKNLYLMQDLNWKHLQLIFPQD